MVFEKVKKLISEQFDVEESGINLEDSFAQDLDADSLDLTELILEMEDEFDLTIPEDVAEKIATVKDAVDYIEKNI